MTKTKTKYQPQPEDMNKNGTLNRQLFVARIVNTENRAMNAKEVHALINKKVEANRGRTHENTQANLGDAVRTGRLDKTRIQLTETKSEVVYHPTNMKPMGLDIPVPRYTHKKDAVKDFDPELFVKHNKDEPEEDFVAYHERRKRERAEAEELRLAGLSSTIQHHFTAEQLLDTLNALNPDLHDDVLVAVYEALGKPVHIGLGSILEPLPRKTEYMKWTFIKGNLVVKQ